MEVLSSDTNITMVNICNTSRRSPVNSTHKGQWPEALRFSLICAWLNGWVNNREAGDLRRNRIHYGVTVMLWICLKRYPMHLEFSWDQLDMFVMKYCEVYQVYFQIIESEYVCIWAASSISLGLVRTTSCRLYSNISQILLLYKTRGY